MNKAWKDYMAKVNKRYRLLKNKPSITRWQIEERIMRLWVEARSFELLPNEYEEMAITTIKEDMTKRAYLYEW